MKRETENIAHSISILNNSVHVCVVPARKHHYLENISPRKYISSVYLIFYDRFKTRGSSRE